MTDKRLKIFIINKVVDISLVELAIKQVRKLDDKTDIVQTSQLLPREGIYILGCNSFDDPLFEKAKKIAKLTNSPLIVVTESQDPFFFAQAARMGIRKLYIIPYELPNFRSQLKKEMNNFIPDKYGNIDLAQKQDEIFKDIIGESFRMQEVFDIARKIAVNESINVLITGETGTGKGLLAKAIHELSPKYKSPFIDINCSALPANLLESELFGHEPGAFTDARVMKIGLFELAEEGTIFLDEIGDLSLDLQVKLLRAIDNKVIRRLGGTNDIPIKARIISATNRNLPQLILEEKFRNDLYHRLNAINIHIPPLRDRDKDVLLISEFLIGRACKRFDKKKIIISDELKDFLMDYLWPGNIRELKNAIERAVLLSEGDYLEKKYLFNVLTPDIEKAFKDKEKKDDTISLTLELNNTTLQAVTELYARKLLDKLKGNKSKTAKVLGLSRPTLDKLLNK